MTEASTLRDVWARLSDTTRAALRDNPHQALSGGILRELLDAGAPVYHAAWPELGDSGGWQLGGSLIEAIEGLNAREALDDARSRLLRMLEGDSSAQADPVDTPPGDEAGDDRRGELARLEADVEASRALVDIFRSAPRLEG